MSLNSGTYYRFIQIARIGVALAFAVAGTGLVTCANLDLPAAWVAGFGIATLASLAIVAVLIAEQLFAAWIVTQRARVSLAALLLMMAAFAALFAVMRRSILLTVLLLLLVGLELVVLSLSLENKRRPKQSSAHGTNPSSCGRPNRAGR
jgi:hypothetical protein